MKLLIMRHGAAEPYLGAETDRNRSLTALGADQVVRAARTLRDEPPGLVLVSPYLRTQQTAQIVQDELSISDSVICDWLTSESPVDMAITELGSLTADRVLLVSHMPLVSLMVEYLTEHREGFSPANVGEVDLVHIGRGQGEFKWKYQT